MFGGLIGVRKQAAAACLAALLSLAACEEATNKQPPTKPPAQPPVVKQTVPDQVFEAGDTAPRTVNLSDHFTGAESYGVSWNLPEVATVKLAGGVLTVTPVAAGDGTATVTARNEGGTVPAQFQVTVKPPERPEPPVLKRSLPDQVFEPGDTAPRTVNLAEYFTGAESYSVSWEVAPGAGWKTGVELATVAGDVLTVTPLLEGSGTVTVTARNEGGTAPTQFQVTVRRAEPPEPPEPTEPPVLKRPLPDQVFEAGDTTARTVNLSDHFTGAESYDVSWNLPDVATVKLAGGVLTVTPVAAGGGTATVTARNEGGTATAQFQVTVKPPPKPSICANGAAAAVDPSSCRRGRYAIAGIDSIPLDLVKVTNREMQKMFAIVDWVEHHLQVVGNVACKSYLTENDCGDRTGKYRDENGNLTTNIGNTPFTEFLFAYDPMYLDWVVPELRSMESDGLKMVSYSLHAVGSDHHTSWGISHLVVHGTGNNNLDDRWWMERMDEPKKRRILGMIAEHKILFVSGFDRERGKYVRHSNSSSCRYISDGCLWTSYNFPGIGGATSWATQNVAAAIASVLSVFPDTSPQNLAKLAKLCAKKTGQGIEQLLSQWGGVGVADFSCMGPITDALESLQPGATTSVAVSGGTVQVGERALVVR